MRILIQQFDLPRHNSRNWERQRWRKLCVRIWTFLAICKGRLSIFPATFCKFQFKFVRNDFFHFKLTRNPRVACHQMPQIDLSAWRENVVQGCTIGGKRVGVGESAFPSPCTSCICTNDGVRLIIFLNWIFDKNFSISTASMRVTSNYRLLAISARVAERDNPSRRCVCSTVWSDTSELKLVWSPPTTRPPTKITSFANTTKSRRWTTDNITLLPRLPLPWPLPIRRRLMSDMKYVHIHYL